MLEKQLSETVLRMQKQGTGMLPQLLVPQLQKQAASSLAEFD
jgi:hypothetical protein